MTMPRRLLILLLALLTLAGCSKSYPADEAILYGAWVNQSAPGDTLTFLRVNGQNLLRYNNSFNPAFPSQNERRYAFKNDQLTIGMQAGESPTWQIDSFTWKVKGKEFELRAYQLYMFMSSSVTVFHYKKV